VYLSHDIALSNNCVLLWSTSVTFSQMHLAPSAIYTIYLWRSLSLITYGCFSFSLWLYSPLDLSRFFNFLVLYTVGGTPWTEDQPVARPLPTHRSTQTQNKHTDIHASSGIRIHDPSVRTGEDVSCFRLRSHCDRPLTVVRMSFYSIWYAYAI
jgi:hypothetical protein